MSYGSLWDRLVRGVRWSWVDARYRAALPADLDAAVMTLESRDRLHAKQGRSTARVVFHPDGRTRASPAIARPWRSTSSGISGCPGRPGWRPWSTRAGRHSPGGRRVGPPRTGQGAGVPVPEVVAAGERIGPWGGLQSYLMVAELTGLRGAERGPARAGGRARSPPRSPASSGGWSPRWPGSRAALHGPGCSTRTCTSATSTSTCERLQRRPARRPAGPDRPASAGRASVLARSLAVEGPGATPLLDRRAWPGSTTATSSGSGSTIAGM